MQTDSQLSHLSDSSEGESNSWMQVVQKVIAKGYYSERVIQDTLQSENGEQVIGKMIQEICKMDEEIYAMCFQAMSESGIEENSLSNSTSQNAAVGLLISSQPLTQNINDIVGLSTDNVVKDEEVKAKKMKTQVNKGNSPRDKVSARSEQEIKENAKDGFNILKDNINTQELEKEKSYKIVDYEITQETDNTIQPVSGESYHINAAVVGNAPIQSMVDDLEMFGKERGALQLQNQQLFHKRYMKMSEEMVSLVKRMEEIIKFATNQLAIREYAKANLVEQLKMAVGQLGRNSVEM